MQDQQYRALCRLAFVLLCIVPTAGILCCAVTSSTQRRARELKQLWEARIQHETGFEAKLASVNTSRGNVLFTNLELFDPETHARLVQVRELQLSRTGKRGWVVEAFYPEIPSDQAVRLVEPLYDRLRAARGSLGTGVITAHHVTLPRGSQADSLSVVECQFGSSSSGGFAQFEFLVSGYEMHERARLTVARDREKSEPQTQISLETGKCPLPCSLAATIVPALKQLGSKAHFAGTARWSLSSAGWRGEELQGRFDHVDLSTLVTDSFPTHLLSGDASIVLERATFQNGRLSVADGSIASDGGAISRSLLTAASQALRWKLAERTDLRDRHRYRKLALEFQIDASGLAVKGKCDAPGAMMEDDAGGILFESAERAQVLDLVRALVPESAHQVPATRQTAWLNSVLPVPDIAAPDRAAQRPESPPLRLQKFD